MSSVMNHLYAACIVLQLNGKLLALPAGSIDCHITDVVLNRHI